MRRAPGAAAAIVAAGGVLGIGAPAHAQTRAPERTFVHSEPTIMHHARGTFDVTLTPQPMTVAAGEPALDRRAIDKRFHGDLDATSAGEMLAVATAVKGSAGYVAVERVSGTLNGRRGTFALQHYGIMDRGAPQQTIMVVPDSGTGELAGLAGTMTITIENGRHSYDFTYTIADAP